MVRGVIDCIWETLIGDRPAKETANNTLGCQLMRESHPMGKEVPLSPEDWLKKPLPPEIASEIRGREHASKFCREVLLPKLEMGEVVDDKRLRELVCEYQSQHEGADFDLGILSEFTHVELLFARNRKRGPAEARQRQLEAAQKADELLCGVLGIRRGE